MTAKRTKIILSKSNTGLFAQLVLISGVTKVGQRYVFEKSKPPVEQSLVFGEDFGKKAVAAGEKTVVFDRNKNRYHGQTKAFAEGLRKAGLEF